MAFYIRLRQGEGGYVIIVRCHVPVDGKVRAYQLRCIWSGHDMFAPVFGQHTNRASERVIFACIWSEHTSCASIWSEHTSCVSICRTRYLPAGNRITGNCSKSRVNVVFAIRMENLPCLQAYTVRLYTDSGIGQLWHADRKYQADAPNHNEYDNGVMAALLLYGRAWVWVWRELKVGSVYFDVP
jgi:hypothetical protein